MDKFTVDEKKITTARVVIFLLIPGNKNPEAARYQCGYCCFDLMPSFSGSFSYEM
jgi:hypothetical protein